MERLMEHLSKKARTLSTSCTALPWRLPHLRKAARTKNTLTNGVPPQMNALAPFLGKKKKRRKRRRRKKLQSHGNPFRVPTAFLRLQLRIWMAVQSLATGNPEFPEKPLTSRVDWSGKDQTFCSPLHDLPKNRA